jgi:DNA-binding CsgD family transcriptional regulator
LVQLFSSRGSGQRFWSRITDADSEVMQQWNKRFRETGLTAGEAALPELDSAVKFELNPIDCLLADELERQVAGVHHQIPGVHIYMLADRHGMMLRVLSDPETTGMLEQLRIVPGVSFRMESIGINAISAAMEMGRITVVDGSEHHLRMFDEWTCVCAPIRMNGEIVGYLDLSFASGTDVTCAALLLERFVQLMEDALSDKTLPSLQDRVMEQFERYGLTPREKEVGYRWLQNESTAQISYELGISEGTVRNMLKSVYAKTEVCGKGPFIHKFLV